jgi:hypothetical protein
MTQTLQEKNKALVLEAFDPLFNKRDYAKAERYCHLITSNMVPTSRPVARGCSIW